MILAKDIGSSFVEETFSPEPLNTLVSAPPAQPARPMASTSNKASEVNRFVMRAEAVVRMLGSGLINSIHSARADLAAEQEGGRR